MKIQYLPLSPDGFAIYPEAAVDTERAAFAALYAWVQRYAKQGYYRTGTGEQIPYPEIVTRSSVQMIIEGGQQFPNGFTSWQETHFEIVDAITHARSTNDPPPLVTQINETAGTGGFYELAKSLTDEFEAAHVGKVWDGDFFDEIESFIKAKIYEQ